MIYKSYDNCLLYRYFLLYIFNVSGEDRKQDGKKKAMEGQGQGRGEKGAGGQGRGEKGAGGQGR